MVNQKEIVDLTTGCTVLGAIDELPVIDMGTIDFQDDTMILAFTDGLNDLRNDKGDYFDDERIKEFAFQHYLLKASSFVTELREEIDRFREKQTYPDDIAVIACKINKP